jgi:hypothetical protein
MATESAEPKASKPGNPASRVYAVLLAAEQHSPYPMFPR